MEYLRKSQIYLIVTGNFVKHLEIRLQQELPGKTAQDKMAPLRTIDSQPLADRLKAGVLILIYTEEKELRTLFIKRTEYEGPHSGQVSFPGGKSETGDKSQIDTALREAFEETGTEPDTLIILGTLTPLYISVSNTEVLPVIAYAGSLPEFRISRKEVEYLIHIPVRDLIENTPVTEKKLVINGYVIRAPGYLIGDEFVWGATAMMLAEFIEVAGETVRAIQ